MRERGGGQRPSGLSPEPARVLAWGCGGMAWDEMKMGAYRLLDDGLVVDKCWQHTETREISRVEPGDADEDWVEYKPTHVEATEVGAYINNFRRRSRFWLGDWWHDAKERFSEDECTQLVDGTEFEIGLLDEWERVAVKIPRSRRFLDQGVGWTIHQSVSALEPARQTEILVRAKEEGLTVAAVRQEVKKIKRKTVSEGKGKLKGRYRVIYLDPDYVAMSMREIAALPVAAHMHDNAALFLWHDEERRFEILEAVEAWGFEHRRTIIWDRILHQGPDHYLDIRHEYLLWCVRGTCPPDNLTPMFDSVTSIRRGPETDEKPEEFRTMIERLYDGPYLELLVRRHMTRKGWTFFGHQFGEKITEVA